MIQRLEHEGDSGGTLTLESAGKIPPVFTLGEVARVCSVSPGILQKEFDSGRMLGYHVPLSRDRRIPYASLCRYMHERNLGSPPEQVVLLALARYSEEQVIRMRELLAGVLDDTVLYLTDNSFSAGMLLKERQPDVFLLEKGILCEDVLQKCQREQRFFPRIRRTSNSRDIVGVLRTEIECGFLRFCDLFSSNENLRSSFPQHLLRENPSQL